MGSSLDQIGPITKTVSDAEILFNAIKGKDAMDSTTINTDNVKQSSGSNLKIGIPADLVDTEGIDESVLKILMNL